MFKKIYIEITNICNLKCSFCAFNNREKKFMTFNNFKKVLSKIKGFTDYIYLHVMGEPLLHPKINQFIDYAVNEGFKVNITTNGYLIKKIENNINVRQVNISLHSFNRKNGVNIDEYLGNIFNVVRRLANHGTYVKYRLWVNCDDKDIILDKLKKQYNLNDIKDKQKLDNNIYFEVEKSFIWPNYDNDYYNEDGSCMGLRNHIGILVDGTIVPCCLDNEGKIKLGNIYKNDINDIISSELFQLLKKGFCNNKKINELCRHCNFYDLRVDK